MAGHTAEEEGEAAAQREEEEAKKQYTRTLSKVKLLPSLVPSSRLLAKLPSSVSS